jgi:hypothetical protein
MTLEESLEMTEVYEVSVRWPPAWELVERSELVGQLVS